MNKTVSLALDKLGYSPDESSEIEAYVDEKNTMVGAPYVKSEHYPIFDCAIGERAIHYMGHVKMMGAVQPFISGAISKTVNMPETATVEDVMQLYIDAWKLGTKAIAIYRDNCKVAQPLSGKSETATGLLAAASAPAAAVAAPRRRRLPDDRVEVGRKFRVGDYEGYIHVGLFEDGTPGDIFVDIAKEGTTLAGLMNSFMIAVSLGLQYGVPLEVYVSKFSHMRFEPSGQTNDADIRVAKSIVDYIFRWMGKKFLTVDQQEEIGILSPEVRARAWQPRTQTAATPRPPPRRRPPRPMPPRRARPRCSTRGRTRSSAAAAEAAWCGRAAATRAATAGLTPAAASRCRAARTGGTVVSSSGLTDEARSYERISLDDLARLAQIARDDREDRVTRRPRWRPYADRVLCVALCQGAALHYVDGRNGVKDFDVYAFYAEHPTGTFPYRWRTEADFGPSRFGQHPDDPDSFHGRRVDLIGRSLDVLPDADPITAVRHYLAAGHTETARQLARKAVVLLEPGPLRGQVIWPTDQRGSWQ